MAQELNINRQRFELYLDASQIAEAVRTLAAKMARDLAHSNPVFLPVLNGAFYFAAELLRCFDFPYELSFIKLASYLGTAPVAAPKTLLGLDENLEGQMVVILEDIVDTGHTLQRISTELKEFGVSGIKVASLMFKSGSLKYPVRPDYFCFEVPMGFLAGYGMDFDRKGRHLKDIYRLKER